MNARRLLPYLAIGAAALGAWWYLRRRAALPAPTIRTLPAAELPGVVLPTINQITDLAPLIFRSAVTTSDAAARGLRNNNPGNIKHNSKNNWQGKAPVQTDPTFVQFTAPAYGIRAIAATLLTYQKSHGLSSVRGLISRWSETDQAPYIRNVAAAIGTGPDDAIDLRARPDLLRGIVVAIIRQENGQQPYSADVINGAVQSALR